MEREEESEGRERKEVKEIAQETILNFKLAVRTNTTDSIAILVEIQL